MMQLSLWAKNISDVTYK